jgi:hypothetical protein
MKFVFGVALGALGMWAYRSGKFESLMGAAPEPVRQAWQPVQDKIEQRRGSEIVTPTPAEVAGRPSEPLPTSGA